MGELTYTVGGANNLTSFRTAARVPIISLKAHFKPTQSGTGDPAPDNVREIHGWNSVDIYHDSVALPVGYKRVEYLYINGGQFVETNYAPTVKPEIRTTMVMMTNSDVDYFGFLNNTEPSFIIDYTGGTSPRWYNRYGSATAANPSIKPIIETKNDYVFGEITTVNGVVAHTFPSVNWSTNQQTLRIGAARNNGSAMKLYSFQFYDGILVFDMVPCIRTSDSKPGLYDVVTDTFFVNNGSGEFEYGEITTNQINITFPVLGKNKLDANYVSNANNYTIVGTYGYTYTEPIFLLPNTQYYLSYNRLGQAADDPTALWAIKIYSGDSYAWDSIGAIKYYDNGNKGFYTYNAFTTGPTGAVRFLINLNGYTSMQDALTEIFTKATWQLEIGDTATTYEPYNANNTVYGGYIDIAKGQLVAEDCVFEIDSTSTIKSFGIGHSVGRPEYSLPYTGANANLLGSNIFALRNRNTAAWNYPTKNCCSLEPNNDVTTSIIFGAPDGITTQSDWTDWLEDNGPIQVWYKMQTPIIYPLIPTQLTSLLDQNAIWSNTNDVTDVSYAVHDTAAIRMAKQRIAANEPHIATTTGAVAAFKTDICAPIQSVKAEFIATQKGTGDPSPSNVRPIIGWTGLTEYKAGKNLVPSPHKYSLGYGGTIYPSRSDTSVSVTETSIIAHPGNSSVGVSVCCGYVKAGQKYTVSWNSTYTSGRVMYVIREQSEITETISNSVGLLESSEWSYTMSSASPMVITPAYSGWLWINYHQNNTLTSEFTISNLQLEVGESATSYTPSTITPIPITFPALGKNLLDSSSGNDVNLYNYNNYTLSDGVITTTTAILMGFKFKCKPSTQYTFSFNTTFSGIGIRVISYTQEPTAIALTDNFIVNTSGTSTTFTTSADSKWLVCGLYANTGGSSTTFSQFQLETGSSATAYKPYTNTIYGGYVDLIKGELVQTHDIIDLGTLSWSHYGDTNVLRSRISTKATSGTLGVICSHYAYNYVSTAANTVDKTINDSRQLNNNSILICDSDYAEYTDNEVKTALNGVICAYRLQTPITYQLTPTQLKSLIGTNNFWSNTNDNTTVSYWTH